MTTKEFVKENKIRATAELVDANPHMADDWPANHYKVRLRMGKKQMTVFYSMGIGLTGEPQVDAVLWCLASDAAGVEYDSFEAWADEYGYDRDSRKAEKTYRIIEKESARLKDFLGDSLYRVLLYDVREDE